MSSSVDPVVFRYIVLFIEFVVGRVECNTRVESFRSFNNSIA